MLAFPKLEGPRVFIASPGDLQYLRHAAHGIVYDLKSGSVRHQDLEVYDWQYEKAEDGFADWIPAQQQIPPPWDPLCRAVICFFGERIGTPLLQSVPPEKLEERLGKYVTPGASGSPRLVHPWRSKEALKIAEDGGFALTGTVFECLAALHANERARADRATSGRSGRPPIRILFLGQEEILNEGKVLSAGWGHKRLRNYVQAKKDKDDDFDGFLSWVQEDYRLQLLQLRNFHRYIANSDDVYKQPVDEENAKVEIRSFLQRTLGIREEVDDRALLKGLEYYDRWDADRFYGRESDRKNAIKRVEEIWNRERPTFYALEGGSGVGKSSFMRAGIIGYLCNPPHVPHGYFTYHGFCVRPAELLEPDGTSDDHKTAGNPLYRLFARALAQLVEDKVIAADSEHPNFDINEEVRSLAELRVELQAPRAVERLEALLESRRLLIGLDQFEEIVDQWMEPEQRGLWEPLMAFIDKALQGSGRKVGIVYTLQTNRGEAMSADPVLSRLYAGEGVYKLTLPGEAGLRELIREVFKRARVHLEPTLENDLVKQITEFADTARTAAERAALMPLISLALRRIYESVVVPKRNLNDVKEAEEKTSDPPDVDTEGDDLSSDDDSRKQSKAESSEIGEQFDKVSNSDGGDGGQAEEREESHEKIELPPRDVVLHSTYTEGSSVLQPRDALRLPVPERLLEVGTAIADHAEAALEKARAAPGPALSEEAVDQFMDLFVRPAALHETPPRYSLPPAPLPTDWTRRRLASEFIRERLLIPDSERPTHAYLVHEAILHNWDRAKEWLENRKALMKLHQSLMHAAQDWESYGRPLERLNAHQARDAAELMVRRWEAFFASETDADTALLKAYCLELLKAYPTPTEPIYRVKDEEGDVGDESEIAGLHIDAAALHRDSDLLRVYLRENPEAVTAKGRDGRSPLFAASIADAVEVAEILLGAGSPADPEDDKRWRPVHLAAYFGSPGVLRLLLEKGASPLSTGPGDTTPLHLAVANGHVATTAMLLDHPKIETDVADEQQWTALHRAVNMDNVELAKLLLDKGAAPDPKLGGGWTPLHQAAHAGQAHMVQLLVNGEAAVDERRQDGRTPLHVAAEKGHASAVRALLKKANPGLTTGEDEQTALHLAAAEGHADVVQVLVEKRGTAEARTKRGETALHIAAQRGHVDVIRALNGHAEPQSLAQSGRWPLLIALEAEQFKAARVLVQEYEAPLDEPRQGGMTVLHLASLKGNEEHVRFLLSVGADPNVRGVDQSTPLHLAAEAGSEAVVEVLLEDVRTDVCAREIGGDTPLHVAAEMGYVSIVAHLLTHDEKLAGTTDDRGWTPLHLAAQAGHAAVIEALLKAGADVEGRTGNGQLRAPLSPLQGAAEVGNDEVVALLMERGARLSAASGDKPPPLALAIQNGFYSTALLLLDELDELEASALSVLRDLFDASRKKRAGGASEVELAQRLGVAETYPTVSVRAVGEAHTATGQVPGRSGDGRPSSLGGVGFYPWEVASPQLIAEMSTPLQFVDGALQFDPERSRLDVVELPWYDNVILLRWTDEDWPQEGLAIYYLLHEGKNLFRLNGASPPIHEVNATAPIRLTEANVLDYLRFFCFFVRGEEGPFHISEILSDPVLPQDLDPPTRKVFENTIHPAIYAGRDERGFFLCDASLFYSNALFDTRFMIQPSGMVEMEDDEPVAPDLPVRINAPIVYNEPDEED